MCVAMEATQVIRPFFYKILRRIFGPRRSAEICFLYLLRYPPHFNNPQTLNEKLQWLKFYSPIETLAKYTDKMEIRKFIQERISSEHLVSLIGCFDSVDDIDYDSLPKSFVMKATHGSDWNIIVKDKTKLNWDQVIKQMQGWLNTNLYEITGEAQYKSLKGRILIEERLEDPSGDVQDYKFYCFNGKPLIVHVDSNRFTGHKRTVYDTNWRQLPVKIRCPHSKHANPKPACFDNMMTISRKLSKDFIFTRVDLYLANQKIFFGELTFTPGSGYIPIDPVQYDRLFGSYLNLHPI